MLIEVAGWWSSPAWSRVSLAADRDLRRGTPQSAPRALARMKLMVLRAVLPGTDRRSWTEPTPCPAQAPTSHLASRHTPDDLPERPTLTCLQQRRRLRPPATTAARDALLAGPARGAGREAPAGRATHGRKDVGGRKGWPSRPRRSTFSLERGGTSPSQSAPVADVGSRREMNSGDCRAPPEGQRHGQRHRLDQRTIFPLTHVGPIGGPRTKDSTNS